MHLEGLEFLEEARSRGRGVVAVTAHLGSFDLCLCASARRLGGLHVVTRSLSNRGLDAVWQGLRGSLGVTLHRPEGSLGELLRALRGGAVVVLLLDQRTPPSWGGAPLPFFGHPAWTTLAPAVLSARTGAPMLPVRCLRDPDGAHRVRLERALEPPGRGRGARLERMAQLNATVERWVREAPESWLWLHDRWRPEGGPPRGAPSGGTNPADL